LDSGQAFRWRWNAGRDGAKAAVGIVGRQILQVEQDARGLWLLSPDAEEARGLLLDYLGCSREPRGVAGIETALAEDGVLARILPRTRGIAILAQDTWEVLISFIISANNNIPKITQSIERLARAFGEPLGDGAPACPTPARLAAARRRTLAACLLGYRAPYVRAAARMVADGDLDLGALRRLPFEAARERLLEVPGVGEKVADCILLFGLGRMAAFPVDVWVTRAVERLYFRGRPRTPRQIQAFARARFGPLAGYAQQHLFAYARAHLRDARTSERPRRALRPRTPARRGHSRGT
jgi:N-glycosylase/DNA lyase